MSKMAVAALLLGLAGLAGCFEWTQDSQGHLQSVGLPGVPVWQSSQPPPPVAPANLGFTPEEASKISGPALVIPGAGSAPYRYRFYQAGQNHCAEDLQQLLAERATSYANGPAPYCTDKPTEPPAKGGSFMGF